MQSTDLFSVWPGWPHGCCLTWDASAWIIYIHYFSWISPAVIKNVFLFHSCYSVNMCKNCDVSMCASRVVCFSRLFPSPPPKSCNRVQCFNPLSAVDRVRGLRCKYCRATVRRAIPITHRETREQQALIGPHPQAARLLPRLKTFPKGVTFYI